MLGACAPVFARTQPKALGVLEYSGSLGGVYLLRRALYLPHELKVILDPEVVREGLRRLKPLLQLQATLACDPGSPIARVCALDRHIIYATSFYATPTGPGWRTPWKSAFPSSTSRCSARSRPPWALLLRGEAKWRWPTRPPSSCPKMSSSAPKLVSACRSESGSPRDLKKLGPGRHPRATGTCLAPMVASGA